MTTETEYKGYTIAVEANPDHYRGGFVWSVSLGDDEMACELEPTQERALIEAELYVDQIILREDLLRCWLS